MQIDFYYWGDMCFLTSEMIKTLHDFSDYFEIKLHDISNDAETAKKLRIFYPFLTIIDHRRYYGPIYPTFLHTLKNGTYPIETPYRIRLGKMQKIGTIQPITAKNLTTVSQCTGRKGCSSCQQKAAMYASAAESIIGFANIENTTLLGGAEFYPSLLVPYPVPKDEDTAFLTCVYTSDELYDYKSAPLAALEAHLFQTYQRLLAVTDEIGTFPNGDLAFFTNNGYHDEGILYEDHYCCLHLVAKYR